MVVTHAVCYIPRLDFYSCMKFVLFDHLLCLPYYFPTSWELGCFIWVTPYRLFCKVGRAECIPTAPEEEYKG